MSTTTDARNGSPPRRTVLWISLALQVSLFALLWFAVPLRTSSMSVNPDEVKLRAAEVEKRERQRLEEERKRREKVAIKDDDAEKLRKKAEAKEVRKVAKKVREMREIRERDASLARLQVRSRIPLAQNTLLSSNRSLPPKPNSPRSTTLAASRPNPHPAHRTRPRT